MRLRSLRARLLLGVAVLVACGLTAGALVTYAEQRSFLLERVDQQVQAAAAPLSFELGVRARVGARGDAAAPDQHTSARRPPPARGHGQPPPAAAAALPPGTFGALLDRRGKVVAERTFSYGARSGSRPALPAHPRLSRLGSLHPFTIGARGHAGSYRAAAFRTPAGQTMLVAVPLHEVNQTLSRLVKVELIVGGGVILALIALGGLVVRIGLRPLARIGQTASEIAAGDLSRRVAPADGRTEVGRLGRSLNEMLAQIEAAFAARRDSEERLRRFLADASHELRTPLAAIRGYAELFGMGAADDPETLARAMSRIEFEAARMGVLVEDLLVLAQLDHAPEPRRVAVDFAELVRQAAEDLRVTAPDRDVAVHLGADRGWTVLGDPSQLRQVLANLTRNAVVHTPTGTAIELSLTGEDGVVEAAVRDHGPGLPAGADSQLFERFWRSEGGRSRGRDGAGLGLAIAAAIVDAHGGSIAAADAPGGGARFVVTLPVASAHPRVAPAATRA
ncbi:MAG TPA: HAMP domain-containing sensor histidine kinase [Solirubrobacteraceae bacterium]|nr:HAMP domain-containing sensor histidine kinase [Solirubrobacteraceae bacterium]